ncbi:hypothetical protein ACNSVR_000595 [Cronobacter malonaticus]
MPEPLDSIIQSAKDSFRERSRSPLYGCIIAAWIAYNWKPIALFILSNEDIYVKIRAISAYASPDRQVWDPLLWGGIAAVSFPLLNGLYGFIEIFTTAIVHSKNNLRDIVALSIRNWREYWDFKLQNSLKVRKAELEYQVSELEMKKAQADYDASLSRYGVANLAEAEERVAELARENERLQTINDEIMQSPLMLLNSKTEDEIAEMLIDYFHFRRNEHRNNPNYIHTSKINFTR